MQSILIAHGDIAFAETLANQPRASGYLTVVTCPGLWPPRRCVRGDKGYCLLTAGGSPPDVDTLRAMRAQAPDVHVAGHEPAALLAQTRALLTTVGKVPTTV